MIGDRWGVTGAEVARAYPCDAHVTAPVLQAWRGVTVAASAAAVWPWLAQLQVAPYSYDWIDNLGRRSPQRLLGLEDPRPGDPFTASFGRRIGRTLAVEPGRSLTGRIGPSVMTYVLEPESDSMTRLLMKIVMGRGRLVAPLLCLGDLVMARGQLLNFARLAAAPSG